MKNYTFLFLIPLALIFTSCSQRAICIVDEKVQPIIHKEAPPPRLSIAPTPAAPTIPKKKEVIVLDAGHGGKDTGTKSDKNHYVEKERTLKTTKIVKNYLEELGYIVKLTRSDDTFVSLTKRAEIANELNASLFVSIHFNHCESPEVQGIEVFYYKDEKNPFNARLLASKKLGEEVLGRITKHTGASSRGVKKANFAVVRETKMPAILIEGGFLSNSEERAKIKDDPYLCFLGWAIARGIDQYLQKK